MEQISDDATSDSSDDDTPVVPNSQLLKLSKAQIEVLLTTIKQLEKQHNSPPCWSQIRDVINFQRLKVFRDPKTGVNNIDYKHKTALYYSDMVYACPQLQYFSVWKYDNHF